MILLSFWEISEFSWAGGKWGALEIGPLLLGPISGKAIFSRYLIYGVFLCLKLCSVGCHAGLLISGALPHCCSCMPVILSVSIETPSWFTICPRCWTISETTCTWKFPVSILFEPLQYGSELLHLTITIQQEHHNSI